MAEACRSAPHGETAARCARAWRGEPTSIALGQRNLVRSGEGFVAPRAVQPAAILRVRLRLHTPTVMMYAPACGSTRSEHGCCANSAEFVDPCTPRLRAHFGACTRSLRACGVHAAVSKVLPQTTVKLLYHLTASFACSGW